MRVAPFLTLLLGLVVGWLLGTHVSDDARSQRRTQRASVNEQSPVSAESPSSVPAKEHGAPDAGRAIARSHAAVGTLVADWTDCPRYTCAFIGKGLTAQIHEYSIEPEDDEAAPVVTLTLWAGEYRLELDIGYGPHVTPVTVEAGATTHLNMRELIDGLGRPPQGFGRLVVFVADIRGEPVAGAGLELSAPDPTEEAGVTGFVLRTDHKGRAAEDVRPGRYRIRFRGHRSTVDVPLGGEAEVHVGYAGEAEVIMRGPFAKMIALRRAGPSPTYLFGQAGRFFYVPPGKYEALLWGSCRRPRRVLRVLSLGPGQRVEYEPDIPPGRIRIRITYRTDTGWAQGDVEQIRVVPLQGGKPIHLGSNWKFVWTDREKRLGAITAELLGIAPGRYRVEYLGGNFKPVSTEVVVGDKTATAELEFKR